MSQTIPDGDPGALPARVAARTAPRRIGRYRVLRTIARGGMAEVYEVEDPDTHERVALKWLAAEGAAVPRFRREIEAMVRLNHPGIARVYASGEEDGAPYLTQELCDGLDIVAYADAHGDPGAPERTREVARLGHDLARALDHIHGHGLVHRDLKPGNIVVMPDGRCKLLDFGIVHVAGAERLTADGEFLGTLAYAAPEQFDGRIPGPGADLYALGCLLFRLFTGTRPFTAPSPAQMARLHLSKAPPRPRSIQRDLPDAVEKIVLSLLRKAPDERPARGNDVADALGAWLEGDIVPKRRSDLDRASKRAVGSEEALLALTDRLDAAGPGDLVVLQSPFGSHRASIVDLALADARARGAEAIEVLHGDDELFDLLSRAGEAEGPTRVALYDLHRWDRASLLALQAARRASRGRGGGAVFVGEREVRGIADDADELDADGIIDVAPLDVPGTARLIGALLHRRPPPTAVARAVHEATAGTPRGVEEVVRRLVQDGLADDVDLDRPVIRWGWRQDATVPVPEGLRWNVDQALSHLEPDAVRLLEASATLGHPALVSVLAGLADLDLSMSPATVARVTASGLVDVRAEAEDEEPSLSPKSALVARLLRERTSAARVRELARRALDADASWPDDVVIRLCLAAGRPKDAVLPALRHATSLLERRQAATAVAFLTSLVHAASNLDLWPADRAGLLLCHAHALLQLRPTDPKIGDDLNAAWNLAEAPEVRAEVLLARARHNTSLGRLHTARAHLGEALAMTDAATSRWTATLLDEASEAAFVARDVSGANRFASRLDAMDRSDGRIGGIHAAATARRAAMAADLPAAMSAAEDAMSRFEASGNHEGGARIASITAELLRLAGRPSQALGTLRRALSQTSESEAPSDAIRLLLSQASIELDLGRLGRAQEAVEAMESAIPAGEDVGLHLRVELMSARVAAATGDAASSRVDTVARRAERSGLVRVVRTARLWRAASLAREGRVHLAAEEFARLIEDLRGTGDGLGLVQAIEIRVRALGGPLDPDSLVRPLRGWPHLASCRSFLLDLHLARATWKAGQLLDPTPDRVAARVLYASIRSDADVEERSALVLGRWGAELGG